MDRRGVSDVDSANVRPQVAIDTEFNGGAGALFVIMSEAETASTDGNVYYKVAPLTGPGALTYTITGKGTTLIDSATDNDIEDATTTKQVLNEASGLVVEATDKLSKFYLHNLHPAAGRRGRHGPGRDRRHQWQPDPRCDQVTSAVTLTIAATDPSGVASMRIINSPDGTTCPTTRFAGPPDRWHHRTVCDHQAVDPDRDEGTHRVCIQFLDSHIGGGNWSVPVCDAILIDTTGPAGTVEHQRRRRQHAARRRQRRGPRDRPDRRRQRPPVQHRRHHGWRPDDGTTFALRHATELDPDPG